MHFMSSASRIAFLPLRVIERLRGWRRIAVIGLYGVIALGVGAMLWRQTRLAGLPDIGEPFDVSTYRTHARVPDERNAFVSYRKAAERYREMNPSEGRAFTKANLDWSKADDTLRGWIIEHAASVSLLREGSECPDEHLEAPKHLSGQAAAAAKSQLIIRLSWIGNVAILEAGRLRAGGDFAGAWALLNAVVRASRHMERAVPTVHCRTTAIIMIQFARDPIINWANDKAVELPLLRRALRDLADAEALTPPVSLTYQTEFLAAEESLANLEPLVAARTRQRSGSSSAGMFAFVPGLEAFLQYEPERSHRVLRLLVANDLAWCDRPVSERPAIAVPRLHLYASDPTTPSATSGIPPEDLARWADSALITSQLSWRLGEIEQWERTDRRSLGMLKEAVAVPLFTREIGRPPASAAEAIRHYLPLPGDTPDRDEADPILEHSEKATET